jgi:hypothetical protein
LGYFRNLKELPKVNKFAQSGHPGKKDDCIHKNLMN